MYGHIALKFNIKPECDVFLKTLDLKYLPISNGNSIFASKKGKIFGPISNVNFRLGCNSLSCWKNFSYVAWSLNTQKMSSTYLKYNSGLNLATKIKEHRSKTSAIGQHLHTCHT